MTDHVGLDVIAALGEGLLEPPAAERARLHLRTCAACAASQAALAEVPAALRGLAQAEPPPLPAAVADRLDAALAAEIGAARAARAPGAALAPAQVSQVPADGVPDAAATRAPVGAGDGAPERLPSIAAAAAWRRRPGRRHPGPGYGDANGHGRRTGRGRGAMVLRPLAAAAAACLLAGGGYALFRVAGPSGTGTSSAAAPHRSASYVSAPNRGGPLIEPAPRASAASSPEVIHSGTSYQPAHLASQVETVLRQHLGTGTGQSGAQAPAGLEGCLQRIAGARQPVLVDEASYRGQPATVIVVPQPAGPGGQVWVAGAGCSTARGDVLAQTAIRSVP